MPSDELERENSELRAAEERYRLGLQRQLALSKRLREYATHLRQALRAQSPRETRSVFAEVAEVSAEALGVARVSVWLFDASRCVLECQHLLVRGQGERATAEIPISDVQGYVRALTSDLLAVDDVTTDPRLHELRRYCADRRIGALLDVPIVVEGETLGVICHEHLGGPRTWHDAEIDFAANLGSVVALAIEAERRHEAQDRARVTDARYRRLVETVPVVIYSIDATTGQLAYVSPAIEGLAGRTAEAWLAGGMDGWIAAIADEDRALVRDRLGLSPAGEVVPELLYRMRREDGAVIWVRDLRAVVRGGAGEPLAVQGAMQDVTAEQERNRLEAELAQQRRFESLGRMAASVAHDFNNVLTVLSLSLAHGGKGGAIAAAMSYARELVSSLLSYARRDPIAVKDVDVDAAIGELVPVLATAIGKDLHLDVDLRAGGACVRISPTELHQLVANLVTNAGEATRGYGQGVRVTTRAAPDGAAVELRISDDGRGMDEDTRARAFDPFFTTKPPGEGTGIGLATCQSIVTRAGGAIDVDSAPGLGTTFRIRLPAVPARAEAAAPGEAAAEAGAEAEAAASPRVLLVEDSPTIGGLMAGVLRDAGYEVVHATTLAEARSALGEASFGVIVTDLQMPDGRGEELVVAARARSAGTAIVVASGEMAVVSGVDAVVTKPFTPEDLKNGVARAIAHRRDAVAE